MQDLFGLGDTPAPAAAAASDPLADFGFGAPAPAAAPAFPPITVFDKDGVRVGFAFTKTPGQPALTDITATFTNSGAAPVTGFSLQVCKRHPKFWPLLALSERQSYVSHVLLLWKSIRALQILVPALLCRVRIQAAITALQSFMQARLLCGSFPHSCQIWQYCGLPM